MLPLIDRSWLTDIVFTFYIEQGTLLSPTSFTMNPSMETSPTMAVLLMVDILDSMEYHSDVKSKRRVIQDTETYLIKYAPTREDYDRRTWENYVVKSCMPFWNLYVIITMVPSPHARNAYHSPMMSRCQSNSDWQLLPTNSFIRLSLSYFFIIYHFDSQHVWRPRR